MDWNLIGATLTVGAFVATCWAAALWPRPAPREFYVIPKDAAAYVQVATSPAAAVTDYYHRAGLTMEAWDTVVVDRDSGRRWVVVRARLVPELRVMRQVAADA